MSRLALVVALAACSHGAPPSSEPLPMRANRQGLPMGDLGKDAVLVQLPKAEYDALRNPWGLPAQ